MPGLGPLAQEVDLSYLNETPSGKAGFIRAQAGHFVDGAGKRIRFFGTNLTATACFTDKATAPGAAQHLRSLGFNLVRLHFMDIEPPNGLLRKDGTLDPEQLDKLDSLISEFKKNGIYVNMNLHVARRYPGIEGEAVRRFGMGKVLDRFYPPFIEMQKDYAKKLLTHKNPYTGLAYTDDPVVFCVELNNENTLLPFWGGNTDDLPEPFSSELNRQWQAWLKAKYGSTAALRKAWSQGEKAPGSEILRGSGGALKAEDWFAQSEGGAQASLSAAGGVLTWKAIKSGTESWNLQLQQKNVPLQAGKGYVLSFKARSPSSLPLMVTVMQDAPPWSALGLSKPVELGPDWKSFELGFQAGDPAKAPVRLNFSSDNKTGEFSFTDLSLREAGAAGLAAGQALEKTNVSKPGAGSTDQARQDWWAFLIETEQNYVQAMKSFLVRDLGIHSMFVDTQADYGGLAGLIREDKFSDFIDVHGYWQHPSFQGGDWNPTNWTIGNTAQSASTENTLTGMALARVQGKPFTVSEYNVPAPSDYAAETLPMLATYAAFQDWDAIYAYTYLDFSPEWNSNKIIGFFSFCGHPGKLVFSPSSALVFRLGLMKAGITPLCLDLPKEGLYRLAAQGKLDLGLLWKSAGAPLSAAATRRFELRLLPGDFQPKLSEPLIATSGTPANFLSDTRELRWDADPGILIISSPSFKLACGSPSGIALDLAGTSLTFPYQTEKPGRVAALQALDGKPVAESAKILFSLASKVENQDMGWNQERSSVSNQWGRGPTVAELVKVSLTLPGSGWKARALDGHGTPGAEIPGKTASGETEFRFGDSHPSLWYLLTR